MNRILRSFAGAEAVAVAFAVEAACVLGHEGGCVHFRALEGACC